MKYGKSPYGYSWGIMYDCYGLILDKGVLYKPVGSTFGCINIIAFLVIHSVPLISQLYTLW